MTPDSSTQFLFDYSDAFITNVYKANVKNNDGYIEVPLKSSESEKSPSAICLPKNTKYKVEKLYIFNNIHNIEKQQYDGELIIEHIPITNDSGNKIYSCFLLKTDPTTSETIIDKIITRDFESKQNVNMNTIINTKLECITNKRNVFIFTNPILVKSTFAEFDKNVKNILFDKYVSNDYQDIIAKNVTESSKNIKEGFQEGATDQSYLECSPTSTSDETLEVYNLQLNGDIITDKSKMEVMRTTINFFVFVIIMAVSACISPFLYKNFVVDLIQKEDQVTGDKKAGSLLAFDVWLTVYFFTLSIVICTVGINIHDSSLTSSGIIFFLFVLLSISVLTYFKMTDPTEYRLNDGNIQTAINSGFLMLLANFTWENIIDILTIYFIWGCMLVAFSLGMFYTNGFSKNNETNTKIRDFILSIGFIYGIFITIYIAYIFSQKG